MTLYRDPTIRFGGEEVGGIRISHMSGITRTLRVSLMETKGKRKPYQVEPLPDDSPAPSGRDWLLDIASAATVDELHAIYSDGLPREHWAAMSARKADLESAQAAEGEASEWARPRAA